MRLSLCMIVRDNEAIIEECLTSIRRWVDEMIVVDTGSTDATPEIAKRLGAKVSYFEWIDDFSAARNASFDRAGGDWLFWMDSDDVISEECGRQLRELANVEHNANVLGHVVQVHCPGEAGADGGDMTVVDHVKLIRNRPDLRFEGRIHEQILSAIRRAGGEVGWSDIYVTHKYGSVTPEARRLKHLRDLRILNKDLADRPDHPFVLSNLGMTYADMEKPGEAIVYLKRSIAVATPNESHLPKANALLAACLLQEEKIKEALSVCESACRQFPEDTELAFRFALALHQSGDSAGAIERYQQILTNAASKENQTFKSRDAGIGGHKTRHNLAIIYSEQGRLPEAEYQWRLALAEAPSFQPGLMGLAETLTKANRWKTAELVAEQWRQNPKTRCAAMWLSSQVHLQHGRLDEAINELNQSRSEFPKHTEIHDALCKILFEAGRLEEAEPVLRDLAKLKPHDGSVRHNLGALYLQQGEAAKAVQYLRESLQLRPGNPATLALLNQAIAASQST